jgi:ASC-1-like (ASCH) protein
MTTYTKNVSEPWFSLIKLGLKRCEGRLNKGDFSKMKKGDYIIFENNDFNFPRKCKCIITSINDYNTFKTYLENETLDKCLPGIDTITNGVKIYHNYFTKDDESKYKIKAIKIKTVI